MPKKIFDSLGHIDAECLDLYCAGRLELAEQEDMRRHLAVCDECREQERIERSVRQAILTHQDVLKPRSEPEAEPLRGWVSWFSPNWGPVAAVAASLLLVVATSSWSSKPAPPVDVMLHAMRGGVPQAAPAGPPLRLRLDLAGLADLGPTAAEIVDEQGRVDATGTVRLEAGYAIFDSECSLRAGRHWVRLRHDAKLLREYELVLE